jgi:hypothetical protein
LLALDFGTLAASEVGRVMMHRIGLRRRAHVEPGDLVLPDSELCRAATEWVAASAPTFLLNHGVRSYLFGAALGRWDRLRFDAETLYLASIMHDVGLSSVHRRGKRALTQIWW